MILDPLAMRKRGKLVGLSAVAMGVVVLVAACLVYLEACGGHARLTGSVLRGETLRRPFGPGFQFVLHPSENGWTIAIYDRRTDVDISRLTPPFHFVPNPRDIEGWHLRNADNTGPNGVGPGNVNAPGLVRQFWFSPSVSAATPTTAAEVQRAQDFGQGVFRIVEYALEDLVPGTKASFGSIRYEVDLTWRTGSWWKEGSRS